MTQDQQDAFEIIHAGEFATLENKQDAPLSIRIVLSEKSCLKLALQPKQIVEFSAGASDARVVLHEGPSEALPRLPIAPYPLRYVEHWRLKSGEAVTIRAALIQIGARGIERSRWDWAEVGHNDFFCPDAQTAEVWAEDMDAVRKAGSSVGALLECIVSGVPAGWGAPVYGKLDADLASAMMSINAAKAVEIGAGLEAAALRGEDAADEMVLQDGAPAFRSNHNGGVLGGISTGQDLVIRVAIKPTSSIRIERETLTKDLQETTVSTRGRHDPCVGIRAVPVAEAMAALVLADHKLRAAASRL